MGIISMNRLKNKYLLEGFIDTHIHTAPDVIGRAKNDIEAAFEAKKEIMGGIVIKSHVEPTAGRAKIAEHVTGIKVFGGVSLNTSVGGLNLDTVKTVVEMDGKVIWLPTLDHPKIDIDFEVVEDIIHLIAEKDCVLATGHLNVDEIFQVLDMAKSLGIWKIIINHPLTKIIGTSIEEQKEMSKYGYLEHCYVACMKQHDNLDPKLMAEAIREVGYGRCIMATDFGQIHNPAPTEGMKMFAESMMRYGIKWDEIEVMCRENPSKLFF
jgi:Family of unknown function (DUF6282)